jgi:hypothetical protein
MTDDPYKWCRRIFASVDVVGSTAFKQRSPENSGKWANTFKLFFDEFPTTLRACFDNMPVIADLKPAKPMSVWKFVGDEILFSAELESHEAAAHHVTAFRNAINEYTEQLRKKPELATLSLKGTIWGAGFPVSNAEVATELGEGKAVLRDYLGPCVDQGFRLCALADVRRIPLSVDIAYMLATTLFRDSSTLKLQCEEPKSHKGVPQSYPHIWLDRRPNGESQEDKILGRRPLLVPGDLRQYLDELYREGRPGLFKPFIVGDRSDLFNVVPPEMGATRRQLMQMSAERTYTPDAPSTTAQTASDTPDPKLPAHTEVDKDSLD